MRLTAILLLSTAIITPHVARAQNALLVGAGGAGGPIGTYASGGGGGGIGGGGGGGRGVSIGGGGGGGGFFGGGGGGGMNGGIYQSGANSGMAAPTSNSGSGATGGSANSGAGYQAGAGGGVGQSAAARGAGGGGGGLGGAGGAAFGNAGVAGQTGGLAGNNPQVSDVMIQPSPYTISDTETDTIIGVGGGGGGGGDDVGTRGGAGALSIAGHVTSAYVFVGGDGGGGAGGYLANGGAGGTGTLEIESGASLKIAGVNGSSPLLVLGGGNGGNSNGIYGGAGGAGGTGALTMDTGSTLILGNQATVTTGDKQYGVGNHLSGGAQGTFTLVGNSTIEVDGTDTATIDSAINGSGTLIKTGTGTLDLEASTTSNRYAGGVDIEAGLLQVNGLPNGYAPSANGSLTFGINPDGTRGRLNVSGTLDLTNAVINIKPATGDYTVGQAYRLIIANNITSAGALPQPNVLGPYAPYLTASGAVGDNKTTYTITIAINDDGNGGNGGNAGPGLVFTSGGFYGANFYAQNASLFATLSAPVGTDVGYWMHGVGSFGHMKGANYNYKGFVAGRGFALNQNLIVGGAISNVYTYANDADKSSVNGTNFGVQLYSIYSPAKWTITTDVAVGHLGNNATRVLPGVGQGKFASNGVYSGASVLMQYDLLQRGPYFASPYAGMSYLFTNTGRGQETGLEQPFNLNLHYGRVQTSLAQASGGMDVGYRTLTRQGLFTAWVGLGGVGTLGNTHTKVIETLSNVRAGVSSQVASVGAFTPAVGVVLTGKNRLWKLAANWGGQFANRTSAQNFSLQGSVKF